MTNKIEQLVKNARVKLFRRNYGLHFFGGIQYKYQLELSKELTHGEAGIQYDYDNEKTYHVGKILLNEIMLNEDDYNYNNLVFVICHEVMHILNQHFARCGNRNPALWNLAGDHVIETELKRMFPTESQILPYKGRYNIIPEVESKFDNPSAEQVYKYLSDKHRSNEIDVQENGDGSYTITDNNTNQSWTVMPTKSDGSTKKDKDIQDDQQQTVSSAAAAFNMIKNNDDSKGNTSNHFFEYFEELFKIKLPWEEILEKAIKKHIIFKPTDRSWKMPNKYFRHLGITLPGYSLGEDKDGVGILIVGVDTSGSISTEELKKFAGVIQDSMVYFDTVRMITHDINVHQVEDFNSNEPEKLSHFVKNIGFQGRGGTSHKYIFNKIEDYWNDKDIIDSLSSVIFLTDGYSDIEEFFDEKKYKWIKNKFPSVFVISDSSWTWDNKFDHVQMIYTKDLESD